ncbi:three-Cys-motif partner protein TcmP [Kitasatospora cineracea]|uniref:Three-Cys-motif partner protein n=1 Tax=Kitasatospora cineracea TaxID=88074 RepID=A0A8G1XFI3_9ACTN|nr:three-Cys-motif partner protein TcmP [Kitasatospora cineracea]ROR46476.1 three-Cys-motif partner protein [Kitasatospora cineracea]
MSNGTSREYWHAPALPSVFKHALLSRYIPKFGGMTGSKSGHEVVYLDGYAGEGRYENGDPGSVDTVLRIAADHQAKGLIRWTCFFAERSASSFAHLESLVGEYCGRGVDARAFHGDVLTLMDDVLAAAVGRPLFLFLDPCGLGLPFDTLVDILARRRRETWPPTELLLNFSMMAVRRIGGNSRSDKGNERTSKRLDEVCGGQWWREYFAAGYSRDADDEVAAEYSRRLGQATGMHTVSVPVTKAPGQKAVYNLVFGTRSNHGLWVFGDAHSRARDTWWEGLELREEDDGLFSVASMQRPDPKKIHDQAIPVMAHNIASLLQQGRAFKLVEHTADVFGEFYGQVPETVARKAVKHLRTAGGTPSDGTGSPIHNLQVLPPLRP